MSSMRQLIYHFNVKRKKRMSTEERYIEFSNLEDTSIENCVLSRLNSLDEQLSTLKEIMARIGLKMRNSTIPTWNNKTDNIEYR